MAAMNPGFRQDIQGLRALAVLLVVLDHARIGPFHGGFIGVDVFFVISGFLITGLLVAEAERTGRVSLLGFYARRARRILPAATLVIVVTVAASTTSSARSRRSGAIEDAVWATFFAANFKFAARRHRLLPERHPALAAPALLVAGRGGAVLPRLAAAGAAPLPVRRVAGPAQRRPPEPRPAGPRPRRLAAGRDRRRLVRLLGVRSTTDPVAAYFSPFTRAWELGIGAAGRVPGTRLILLPAGGAGGCCPGAGWPRSRSRRSFQRRPRRSPGTPPRCRSSAPRRCWPAACAPAAWGPQRLLRAAPMRAVGDWSYSLYLWHWPALIIVSEAWRPAVGWVGALVIAAGHPALRGDLLLRGEPVPDARRSSGCAGCAACCSTRRSSCSPCRCWPRPTAWSRASSPAAARRSPSASEAPRRAGPGSARTRSSRWWRPRSRRPQNGYEIPADLKPSLLDLGTDIPDLGECQYFEINTDRPLCPRGDTEGDKTLVLIGDSHARQWVPALDELAKRYGYTAYFLIREGCPSSDVTPWMVHGGPSTDCEAFQEWARDQVEEMQPEVVLLGSEANRRGFADDDGEHVDDVPTMATMYREGMEREIDYLAPNTERVIVIGDPPAVMVHPGRCLSERDASLKTCLSKEDEVSLVFIDALRQAARNKGVEFVETAAWFCADGLCPSVVGDYIAHRDRTHVSETYAGYLTDELEEQIHLDPSYVPARAAASASPGPSPRPRAVSQPAHGPASHTGTTSKGCARSPC